MKFLRRNKRPVPQTFVLPFILPGNVRVDIEAESCQQALLIIRRDYGVKASREAFLAE